VSCRFIDTLLWTADWHNDFLCPVYNQAPVSHQLICIILLSSFHPASNLLLEFLHSLVPCFVTWPCWHAVFLQILGWHFSHVLQVICFVQKNEFLTQDIWLCMTCKTCMGTLLMYWQWYNGRMFGLAFWSKQDLYFCMLGDMFRGTLCSR